MTFSISKYIPNTPALLRAACSAIPYVGGPLDHLLFDKAGEIRLQNIEASIQAMGAQVREVGESAIDKTWFESPEALATIKMLTDKVSFESDPRKVEAMGRVAGACGNKAHSKDSAKFAVVEHLSRLSTVQIKLLSVLSQIPVQEKQVGGGDIVYNITAIWLSDILSTLRSIEPFWKGSLDLAEALEVLESFNTVRRVDAAGSSDAAFTVTSIGKRAAKYVQTANI